MNRKTISFEKAQEYLDGGWSVAWFAKDDEDGYLLIDYFANWRLQDGKVAFVRCEYPGDRLFADWAGKALALWNKEYRRMAEGVFND